MNKKLQSTTFWITIMCITLIPLSWFVEYLLKVRLLRVIVEQHLQSTIDVESILISIPLGPIVTLCTLAVSAYMARKAGREISTNMSLPIGQHAGTPDSKVDKEV